MPKKKSIYVSRKTNWFVLFIPYILLALAAIMVYSNSFDCAFQLDDSSNFAQREIIRDLGNFKDLSLWTDVNFRPLAIYSFALNYHWSKLNVEGFHVFNLIIHILTSFTVFLFIRKILSLSQQKSDKNVTFMAFFTALIFSIHPIQTQSVTYIVQRMTSMSGLFYMLSVYFYTVARHKHIYDNNSLKVLIFYIFSFISFLVSLLSKQIAVTIPLALILIEVCFIRDKNGKVFKKYIYTFIAILILAFAVVTLTGNLPRETDEISRYNYLITQFRVIVKYVQLLLLPINQNLDHDISISANLWRLQELTSLLFISFLIFLSIYFFKKNKLISFGIAWFFVTQALESTIIPIRDIIFEHRLYLATMGYSLILVTVISHFIKKKRIYIIIMLVVISTVYGYAAFTRNKVWKTRYTLWSDTVKKSPHKTRPNYNMGNQLSNSGRYEMAIKYYMKALEREPDNFLVYTNLGYAWNYLGNIDKAIAMYKKAIKLNPNHLKALKNLGILQYNKNNLDEAAEYYERSRELEPEDATVHNFLGTIYGRQNEYEKAEKCFKEALKIDSSFTDPMKNLSTVYLQQNKLEHAKELYEKILKIEPENEKVWYDLGKIWDSKNEFTKAIECYQKALLIKPDFEKAEKKLKNAEQKSFNRG